MCARCVATMARTKGRQPRKSLPVRMPPEDPKAEAARKARLRAENIAKYRARKVLHGALLVHEGHIARMPLRVPRLTVDHEVW